MYDYIVSLYALGARRPSDCLPEYYPTRSVAHDAAVAALIDAEIARASGDTEHARIIGWPHRFTIRRVRREP